ncbi:nucleotidyltransferase [Anaerosalibacter sp. Marseille-P3206]|uniref:nucleotidyltransferase n=1 Tax=Anaerosalibacter sp. Marseille-P3206 TaxID=1871005 RepID=UPI000984A7EA|nr:nucleotidyltransferase [Anaerosalibacter sp. Marseille-P3206]
MKVVSFIVEYNPFHYGHLYHLNKSKEITGCDYSVAVMSGSFVQRGEPSLIDKWSKAKMAVENGVDLVIEMPTIYSIQSAELFALGGIKLLNSLNIIDYISFGSEIGYIEPLKILAELFVEEPNEYKSLLKKHLDNGLSFSIARSNATVEYLSKRRNVKYDFKNILESSNNILAIEYLKILYKYNFDIIPITINRVGQGYKEEDISNTIASATAIRKELFNNNLDIVKNNLPPKSYNILLDYLHRYQYFNKLDNYSKILMYLLRTVDKETLLQILDMENGLENRLIKYGLKYNSITQVIDETTTKRYPKSRIQRILIQLLLNLDKKTFIRLNNSYPNYIRVLGMNEKGMFLLRKIKSNSKLPIINRFSDYYKYKNPYLDEIIQYDKIATDLFFLGLGTNQINLGNKDFTTSPYINK